MSTIKVNSIKNTSTADGGIVIDGSGHVTVDDLQMPTAGALSNRNKIINGAMAHDQRNAGSAVTHTGSGNLYVLDRWVCNSTGTPQFSVQRVADGPTGFSYSSKLTTTTSGTPASGDFSYYAHYIEGNNVADLVFGTANAKTITVSFYVKSSLTGTFGGALKNAVPNRAYPFSYTITSANTWEYKTITIAGDTAGTWATDATIGLNLAFDTGSGSNNKGTAGAWAATAGLGVTGGVNLVESASATWQITGVQLEVGSKATPFEHRSYGDEFSRCERYYQGWRVVNYQAGYSVNARGAGGWVSFHTSMRASPGTIDTSSITYSNASGLSPQEPNVGGFGSYFVLSADGTCRCSYDFAADAEL